MKRRYFLYSQIEREFDKMDSESKITTLVTALEIQEIHPENTKKISIATAMGYKLSISGSGYFEKN